MFSIYDGRESFYQWDIDRKLIVEDETIKEVHFCNGSEECSLVCEVYTEDNKRIVNVPNILLQSCKRVRAYGYSENHTRYCKVFNVVKRSKPEDYIYRETEIKSYKYLEKRINEIESKGVSTEELNNAISEYFIANPVETGATEAEAAQIKQNAADIKELQNKEVDLTGYATEEYVDNAISSTDEKYELIETIVLEEPIQWISSSRYPNNYKKMMLCMFIPPDGVQRTGYARVSNKANWTMSGCGGKVSISGAGDWKFCSRFYFELINGIWEVKGYSGSEADMSSLFGQVACGNIFTEKTVPYVNMWQIYTFAQAYPAGTEVKVYGIKEG